jgi:hypothetical protein
MRSPARPVVASSRARQRLDNGDPLAVASQGLCGRELIGIQRLAGPWLGPTGRRQDAGVLGQPPFGSGDDRPLTRQQPARGEPRLAVGGTQRHHRCVPKVLIGGRPNVGDGGALPKRAGDLGEGVPRRAANVLC